MNTLSYKTVSINKETAQKEWVIVDATDQVVGRLCSKVAKLIRGKYKPTFTPHVDCGDNVIILNSDKLVLTGKKEEQKYFKRYSGYTSGLKEIQYKKMMAEQSDVALMRAIKGMLPKNSLGRTMATHVHIYKGAEHNNAAQKPEVWNGGNL